MHKWGQGEGEEKMKNNNNGKKDRLSYRGGSFVMCKRGLVYHGKKIDTGAFNCWMVLRSFIFERDERGNYEVCWPGRKLIGIMMGKSPSQVTLYLKELRKAGLLKTHQVGQTFYHELFDPPKSWEMECRKKIKQAQQEEELDRLEKIRPVGVQF